MQQPRSSLRWTALAALFLLSACPETEPSVSYTGAGEAGQGAAGVAAHSGGGGGGSGSAGSSGSGGKSSGSGCAGTSGSGGKSSSAGTSGAAGSAGSSAESTSVSFTVTTMPLGGKYQPKNIGAIWIETRDGEFVKTLELWAKTRRRYLTKFNKAVGTAGTVDVTASATLLMHKTHDVLWHHIDRSALNRSPGPYRLCVEVTDASATGQNYCLDFDSSAGAQTLTPADQTYFKALSLSVD